MANTQLYIIDENTGEFLGLKLIDSGDGSGYSLSTSGGSSSSSSTSDTATLSNVASSASNVTLAAANVSRLGLSIYNDSVANLYTKLGAVASLTSFTIMLAPGGYYEVPFGYTGRVDGIWATASGSARITEFT